MSFLCEKEGPFFAKKSFFAGPFNVLLQTIGQEFAVGYAAVVKTIEQKRLRFRKLMGRLLYLVRIIVEEWGFQAQYVMNAK